MKHRMSRAIDAVELKISIAYSNILEDGKSLDQIIDEQPTIEPEPHWIPCSERLPERGKDVIVTRDYDGRADHNKSCRYVEVASCYGKNDDVAWSSYSDEYKMHPNNHNVIAWMPLPEPYAERSNG